MNKILTSFCFLLFSLSLSAQDNWIEMGNSIKNYVVHNLIPNKFEVNEQYIGNVNIGFPNGYNFLTDLDAATALRFNMDLEGEQKKFDIYFKLLGDGSIDVMYGNLFNVFNAKENINIDYNASVNIPALAPMLEKAKNTAWDMWNQASSYIKKQSNANTSTRREQLPSASIPPEGEGIPNKRRRPNVPPGG